MKTRWLELISNSNNKLSGSGFIGILTGITALLCFITGVILVWLGNASGLEVMTTSSYVITIAGALLGIRRFTIPNDKEKK